MSCQHYFEQPWIAPKPTNSGSPALVINNSLTRSKDPFVPSTPGRVSVFQCGPTTYSSSHVGHARCYTVLDICWRIMSYLGSGSGSGGDAEFNGGLGEVFLAMNITDIDDKIIMRARKEHLSKVYWEDAAGKKDAAVAAVVADWREKAFPMFDKKREGLEAEDAKRIMMDKQKDAMEAAIAAFEANNNSNNGAAESDPLEALKAAVGDCIADWLDAERGSTVTDHSIFASLARKYEHEFFEDMKALGVKPPDVVTRVSEYVPEVVAYVEKIIENGHAYESNGSVYFHTSNFGKTHQYAKLAPEHVQNAALRDEGEGALSSAGSEKKNPADFALWKKSKAGEPAWDSPWGPGRPGWHIECSAMASSVFPGHPFDIHAGGIDLRFPHHDNELAQAEAYYECPQWVNYFMHVGHVHIEGLKMSKSLKNFITIREALELYTGRQIRMHFLSHAWDAPMDFSESGMQAAVKRESYFKEFFHAARDAVAVAEENRDSHIEKWSPLEVQLDARLTEIKAAVHAALCDNLDFSKAMDLLQELVKECNGYLNKANREEGGARGHVVRNAAAFITKIFRVFGLVSDGTESGIDFGFDSGASGADSASGEAGGNAKTMSYLRALADFREDVRSLAREGGDKRAFLALCDQLRDDVLPELGVRLEDNAATGRAVVKLEDPAVLIAEVAKKKEMAAEIAARKAAAREEAQRVAAERAAREERCKIEPEDLFKPENDPRGWEAFDDNGLPTVAKGGAELTEEERKNLEKELKAHIKLRKKILRPKKDKKGGKVKGKDKAPEGN